MTPRERAEVTALVRTSHPDATVDAEPDGSLTVFVPGDPNLFAQISSVTSPLVLLFAGALP